MLASVVSVKTFIRFKYKNMDPRLQKVEQEIELIKQRNLKVEADKAWEISLFRKISIAIATYIVASIAMYFIGVGKFFGTFFPRCHCRL